MTDFTPSRDPLRQPYRNEFGEAVTFTRQQCAAIYRALMVYSETVPPEKRIFDVEEALHIFSLIQAKSCLMGRLLYDGRPPLVDAPPVVDAAPDYSVEVRR